MNTAEHLFMTGIEVPPQWSTCHAHAATMRNEGAHSGFPSLYCRCVIWPPTTLYVRKGIADFLICSDCTALLFYQLHRMGIWKACESEAVSHQFDYGLGVLMDESGNIHGILLCVYLQWLDPPVFSAWDLRRLPNINSIRMCHIIRINVLICKINVQAVASQR
jgi:hypothetical protein